MKRRIMAFLLSFAVILTMAQPLAVNAEETSGYDYEVITPDGYDDDHAYPVIYVMPEDGYAQDDSGITEKLQDAMADGTSTKMIIVETVFGAETDLYAAMDAIVAEVDAEYNTIADADHRAIVGTGVGGYLAYILALTDEYTATVEEDAENPFEDVAEDSYYTDAVLWAVEAGITKGTSDTTFNPAGEITRAQYITMLYRLAGEPDVEYSETFEDVAEGMYYTNAVMWAVKAGITNGVSKKTFGINDVVTREQMATFMYRYAKSEGIDLGKSAELEKYPDFDKISEYAIEPMKWAVGNGIINGVANGSEVKLSPKEDATRAQNVTVLQRFAPAVISIETLSEPELFKYVVSTRGDFVSKENTWYAAYGDVYDYLEEIGRANIAKFYTYMDAPVTDTYTNMEGSSNDIGALFINFGTGSANHEYTVRKGEFTDEFMTESVSRIADRVTNGLLSGVVSGTVSLEKAALPSDVEKVVVNYSVTANDALATLSSVGEEIAITISLPKTSVTVEETISAGKTVEGTVEIDNIVDGSSANVQLSVALLGKEIDLATTTLTRIQDTVIDGDYQYMDLMGDWHFKYMGQGNKAGLDVTELLSSKEYEEWDVVQPALTQWTKGFGNISDENVSSKWGPDYFDFMIYGDGYYVRTFDLPENFDAQDLVLSVGYMDDRGEVFINGTRVGATGMTEEGVANGESAWAIYSYYEIDPSVLKLGETNTIVVRCQNDGVGGGGWYGGPIALYSKTAFESDESTSSLFTEYEFDSKYAASAQGLTGTVANKYLVYLPDGYYENTDKYYPTVYMMHQYNSDHTSYIIDDIDTLIDEAIKAALIDEMIVVVPNSAESSWWRGDWMKMVTDELVPLIDSQYRTINDARYRFTAGCSMGGQGAFGVALTNPDLFSGAISFFGAFSMGGDASPNKIAAQESAEYMDYFTMYFICGNQDVYGFGEPAIELNQQLEAMEVEHEFFIENGGHDSVFYLPHFVDAFVYTRDNMYQSGDAELIATQLEGALSVNSKGILRVDFEAARGIENYYNYIPDSSYTPEGTPELAVPLTIEVVQDGEVVYTAVERDFAIYRGYTTEVFKYDLSKDVDLNTEYTITYKVSVLDHIIELDSVVMNEGK